MECNTGTYYQNVALGVIIVSVLATGPKVRGFKPGQGRWIFKGDNAFLRRGSKAVKPHVARFYMLKILAEYDKRYYVGYIQGNLSNSLLSY
jgi:hypothetical protein